jgi:hypothetical protein
MVKLAVGNQNQPTAEKPVAKNLAVFWFIEFFSSQRSFVKILQQ